MLLAGTTLERMGERSHPALGANGYADMPRVARLRGQGVWRWGVSSDMPPLSYRNSITGHYSGLEIDIAKHLTSSFFGVDIAAVGPHIQFIEVDFADRISSLMEHRVDSVIEVFVENPERLEMVNFAGCYLSGKPALVANADCPEIRDLSDLRQRRIAVLEASTGSRLLEDIAPHSGIVLPNATECMDAVRNGTVDAFWGSLAENFSYLNDGRSHFTQFALNVPAEPWKIAVRKDAPDLSSVINSYMCGLIADGTLACLMDRWFRNATV